MRAVILAGGPAPVAGFRAVQAAPANASRRGFVEQVHGASHATMLNDDFADAVVRGIDHVRSVEAA